MKKILITGGKGDWAQSFKEKFSSVYDVVTPGRQELDVTSVESVKEFFSNKHFDIVINNAGTIHPKRILEANDSDWIHDINVNLVGVFLVTKYALQVSSKTTIINISSAAGFSAYPDWSSYCASKAAVNTLTKSVANDGYQVFALCPGGFDTKFRNYFDLDNSNLMSCDEVSGYVDAIINGSYNTGDVIFFRKDDVQVF